MKISLKGLVLSDPKMANKLANIFTHNGQPVKAEIALDLLIQEYVNVRLGGTSEIFDESRFPDREFTLQIPNYGLALIQRSQRLTHLEIIMPRPDGEVKQ